MKSLKVFALTLSLSALALMLALLPLRAGIAEAQGPELLRPVVAQDVQHDTSPPLAAIKPIAPVEDSTAIEIPGFLRQALNGKEPARPVSQGDPIVQSRPGEIAMPSPLNNFEGVNNINGVLPPDTNGDIGYSGSTRYYIQWVNLAFAIWDVTSTPTLAYGPVNGNTLWSGFGGACESSNDGDPIVLYDSLSQRWLMSQFALPNFPTGPFYQCIAVSATSDPLGAWHRYAFQVSNTKMNDYPHFGVWPDAYYMTVNQFASGSLGWAGAGAYAFDRAKMLAGLPATFVYFDLFGVDQNFGGMLPSDLDGLTPPPAGAPNYFAEVDDSSYLPPNDAVRIWEFHVDWSNPSNSTFGLSGQPNATLTVANFDMLCSSTRNCVPQPGTSQRLDAIGDRLMFRLAYRNFGSYQTLVVNHTVDAGSSRAGVRWYELRKTANWNVYQQSTYAPAGSEHRWMGSAAMDHAGNIALGYSVSSASVYPSIRYTGRLAGDPLNQMSQGETTLIAGSGAQTHSAARWGDYSMMSIDPRDDCTFWYTDEYIQATASAAWRTRIGSFKFPTCDIGPTGTLAGVVASASNGSPIAGAQISASSGPTLTFNTLSGPGGVYTLTLPVATYTAEAAAYGYQTSQVGGVSIVSGTTTTRNFSLTPLAGRVVSGTVRDSLTNWPLYAHLTIQGDPANPPPPYNDLWNDPVTGYYSVTLAEGVTYTFNIDPWVGGYGNLVKNVGPLTGNRTEDFKPVANIETCDAPGYRLDYVYYEDFELGNGGYTISATVTSWAHGAPTSGPGSAHSGNKVWATNLSGNYSPNENGYLISPNIDLSAYAGQNPVLEWQQWLDSEPNYDYASVEVSKDGGATWVRVYGELSGHFGTGWSKISLVLDPSYSANNFRVRFRFRSDLTIAYPGWYIDDIGIGAVTTPPTTIAFSKDFEGGKGGFNTSGVTTWARGTPTSGPGSAHSGVRAWATNPAGNYNNNEDGYLISGLINLSAYAGTGQVPTLSWWQWFRSEATFDYGTLEVSKDGGATWTAAYGPRSGVVDQEWTLRSVVLDPSYLVNNFQMRFHFHSDFSVTFAGWYIDDVQIGLSAPFTATINCLPRSGGLIVGEVYDANTNAALAGATVTGDQGQFAVAAVTVDPRVADSFYTLFSPAGSHLLTATMPGGYGPVVANTNVVQSNTVRQNFSLPAGRLIYSPTSLSVTLSTGTNTNLPSTLNNTGGLAATFDLIEIDKGFDAIPAGPFQRAQYVVKSFRQGAPDTRDLKLLPLPPAPPLAAGDVIRSWQPGWAEAWGIAYDNVSNSVWVGDGWGDRNAVVEFTPDGAPTGREQTYSWPVGSNGPADMAFNPKTRTMWVLGVGASVGANCLFEIDPDDGYTGQSICPDGTGFDVSQRGVAYDPSTDTYFIGGWNEGLIYRINAGGSVLSSVDVGLPIAGLAYNPDTQHLFVMINDLNTAVYVLDAANNYDAVGQFGIQGFSQYGGAGLEMDCDGKLWAVDQVADRVYEFESGEAATTACQSDVPWLSLSPANGTLAANANQAINVVFDAGAVAQPGQYHAQLKIKENTPYGAANIPVSMTVTVPPNWGQISGSVYDLRYCDMSPALLAGAQVLLTYGGGMTHTFVQGPEAWSLWAPAGLISINASAADHIPQTAYTVIEANQTINKDVNLRWLHNCGVVTPAAIEVAMSPNQVRSVPISLTNEGTLPWSWVLSENSTWLSIAGASSGTTPADSRLSSQLRIDSTGMTPGSQFTTLVNIAHDDDLKASPLQLLVRVTVPGGSLPLKTYLPVISK